MLISYSSVGRRLEVKKKKIRGQNSRYEYACNQIFATCSSLKKKKKKRVSGILKREPCQIWISEVEPWSRPTNVILDTPCYIEIYVFNTRKRDQFFKPTRGKRFTKERERERTERKSGVERVCVFVYSTRQKFSALEREVWILLLRSYRWILFSEIFLFLRFQISRNFFQTTDLFIIFLLITTIINKNLGERKKFRDQRV